MSLYGALNVVQERLFDSPDVKITNFVWKLHHQMTVGVLLAFSILLSLSQVIRL